MSASVTTSTTPALSVSNVTSAPTTTMLGIGLLAQLLSTVAATGIPTTSAGWAPLALQAIMGIGGLFGR